MVVENNEVFYFEGNITGDHLHIIIETKLEKR